MQPKRRFSFYSLVLLSFLLLSGISFGSANAAAELQEVTNTPVPPTATLEPLFKTPTMAPTLDTACPGAMPSNWGTSTPGPLWLAQCYGCMLTLTPQVTGTPAPVSTFWIPVTQTIIAGTVAACQTVSPGGEDCYLTLTPGPTGTATPTAGTPGLPTCSVSTATPLFSTATVTPAPGGWTIFNDDSASITYANPAPWGDNNSCGSLCYNGDEHSSGSESASWSWTGLASGLRVYSTRGPSWGWQDFYVDDVWVGEVNNYNGSWVTRSLRFSYSALYGVHTFKAVRRTAIAELDYIEIGTTVLPTPTAVTDVMYCGGCTGSGTRHITFHCENNGGCGSTVGSWSFSNNVIDHQVTIFMRTVHTETYGTSQNRVNDELRMVAAGGFSSTFSNVPGFCLSGYGTNVTCSAAYSRSETIHQNSSYPAGVITLQMIAAPDWPSTTTYQKFDLDIYMSAECTNWVTAAAGPGGTPGPANGYCASVLGAAPVDLSDLPNIQVGPASCISFGPFTIGLSSLNWLPGLSGITDVSVPQVEVCFRELYLGSVSIFGMSFSLDILSAVISGILALRWMFRS